MMHSEQISLLRELFEEDQFERLSLFQIKPLIMNLKIDQIHSAISELEKAKNEKNEEGIFSKEFIERISSFIKRLNGISTQNLDSLKKEFESVNFEKLNFNDTLRRKEVSKLMSLIINSSAIDNYCAAVIYNHGVNNDDANLAFNYSTRALESIKMHDNSSFAKKIRDEYSFTFDRNQLTQGKPQLYGTSYAAKDDLSKGWKKDELIPPFIGYQYDREQMEKARNELGIKSLVQQELDWGIRKTDVVSTPVGQTANFSITSSRNLNRK